MSGLECGGTSPQIALSHDAYSARWGDFILSGRFPRPPSLCDLSVDRTCAYDRRETMPLATASIFRWVVVTDLAQRSSAEKREPASFDADATAALSVWGALE